MAVRYRRPFGFAMSAAVLLVMMLACVIRPADAETMERANDAVGIGIAVTNIDASLKFYQEMLGLEFVQKLATRTGTATMYRLRFGKSDVKLLEIPKAPPSGPVGLTAQSGFRYVTFEIKNLSSLCIELRKKGVPFEIPENESRPGLRLAMVRDPDGNIIELVELDPRVQSDFK
jgi:catechol 2,3-dioxygenase-like lactoylglutathione lyase family enzyme